MILDEIGVNESIETYGIGSVYARDNFMLDPNFQFAGDFTMMASDAFLMFNGARFWFRPMVELWLREHRLVEGMAQYVKNPREGAKVNLLFSFTPMAPLSCVSRCAHSQIPPC